MTRTMLVLAFLVTPGVATADLSLVGVTYQCERGVRVPVTYVNDGQGGSVAVLVVEGRQVALLPEAAASGVRYGWPSDGSHYVWWSKGMHAATLFWHDGETGEERVLLEDCLSH